MEEQQNASTHLVFLRGPDTTKARLLLYPPISWYNLHADRVTPDNLESNIVETSIVTIYPALSF